MTDLIKFIHILTVLGLLGATLYCFIVVRSPKKTAAVLTCSRIILYLSLVALLTGTLLVYPKHYTFHTPWIIAAYILLILFSTGITLTKRKLTQSTQPRWYYRFSYLMLIALLLIVIHDAVTKTTFIL